MTKNQKILLGVGAFVVVAGGIGIAVYSSRKKKRQLEEQRQREYQMSLQNQGTGGYTPTGEQPKTDLAGNVASIFGSIADIWKNRPNKDKKDPRDVEPLDRPTITPIQSGASDVPPPDWGNLAFSGIDGGLTHVEVGSELTDLD